MATTNVGVNHPLAQKLWSRKLFTEVTGDLGISRFMGEGADNIIQIKSETSKGSGDSITVGLRELLSGAGIQGDNTQEGNEEALSLYNDAVVINQLRHATRSQGKMSEQRVPWSVRMENKDSLADWWKERIETSIFNQLAGNTAQSDTRYTGNNATSAPSTATGVTRLIVGNGKIAEGSLSSVATHAIDLADLDSCVAIAKVQTPRIRPVRVNGKNMFVAFLHPYAIRQLRAQTSAGGWYELHSDMLQGGKYKDNPILTGSEFIYNNVIVYESSYLPATVGATAAINATCKRGVFCGAQAAIQAYGQGGSKNKMSWNEEQFDYGNQLGVSAGMISGCTKTVFNSSDFGVITLAGYAPAP